MARKTGKMKVVAAAALAAADKVTAKEAIKRTAAKIAANSAALDEKSSWSNTFGRMASTTAHWTGKPIAFLAASACVIVWAATGPLFHYSDTWQLVINTSTTIVTFLMVFLIQNTQNRDTMALQLKLSELVLAVNDAEDRVAGAEDLSDDELERLHKELRARADAACETLKTRKGSQSRKAS
jgi:low affinity Fe/Cu permease